MEKWLLPLLIVAVLSTSGRVANEYNAVLPRVHTLEAPVLPVMEGGL